MDEVTELLLDNGVEVSPMRVVVIPFILSLVLARVVVSRELVVEDIPDEPVDVIVEVDERLEEGPVVEGVVIVDVDIVVVVSPLEGVDVIVVVDPIVEGTVVEEDEDGMNVFTVVLNRLEVEGILVVDSDGVIVVRVEVEGLVD